MRVVRGGPGTGKTALVFREFKAALARAAVARIEPRIVVPTATLVRHFQHELARDGVVCRPGAVVSLSRLAAELAPGLQQVPTGLLRAVIREQLDKLKPTAFAEAAKTAGMAAVVEETIGLFENAGCTAERLASVKGLQPRARAFAQVWRAVEQTIAAAGYSGKLGIYRAAAANAKPMHLWFDGFLHFSELERELVDALAAAGPVTVTAPEYAEGKTLFDERTLGEPRVPGLTAVVAETVEREADEIARRIIELQAGGTALREIGIAVRDAATYESLLRGTLERFGIPARFYYGRPLQSSPAAVFLSGLVECALNDWRHGQVLEALRADPARGNSAAFDRFDFEVREAMPGRGVEGLLAKAPEEYERRLRECTSIAAWPKERVTAREWARKLEHYATRLYRPGRIESPLAWSDVETARAQAAGMRAWVDAVTQVAELWSAEAVLSLAEYWRVAREAVRDSGYRIADDRRDVVHVMSAWEARQWDVSVLFVCGMTNRNYPSRPAPSLLFPDNEADMLRKQGIPLRRAQEVESDERELWEELRHRARTALVVTWPKHDAGGRSVEPSGYVAEAGAGVAPRVTTVERGSNRTGTRGRIYDPELLAKLAALHPEVSVTALEDLSQCRFRFFAARTLKLRSRPERPEERLGFSTVGLILHSAMETWLNENRAEPFPAVAEREFEKACVEMHLPAGFRLEVHRQFVRGVAEKVSTSERWDAIETHAELEFLLPLTSTLNVRGRIDRVDRINDTDAVVVDYKSGKVKRVEGFTESKTKLQGPLYAMAVREALKLRTVAMMYIAIREDKQFGWGELPGVEDLKPMPEDWIESAQARAIERVEELLAGRIQAVPTEEGECRWCDFAAACHVKEDGLVMIAGVSHE